MDHFQIIYASKAPEYHRMIAVEDVDNHLLPALESVTPFQGKTILDLGSGTGRIPILLNGYHAQLIALDLQRAMLLEQAKQRETIAGTWDMVQGDMRFLPFPAGTADIVIAGWAIGHMRSWFESDWRHKVQTVIHEMQRVTVRGGSLFICETMTTGSLAPAAPNAGLAEYYAWLENDWGFSKQVIQTDYQFSSVEEAAHHTEFFFGAELAGLIRKNGWARLPEWTGIWSKTI